MQSPVVFGSKAVSSVPWRGSSWPAQHGQRKGSSVEKGSLSPAGKYLELSPASTKGPVCCE